MKNAEADACRAAPALVLDLELDLSLPSSMVLIEAREAIRLIDQSDISERGRSTIMLFGTFYISTTKTRAALWQVM